MLRKSVLLFTAHFLFMALAVVGCCNCPDPPVLRFRWTQIDVAQYRYERDNKEAITVTPVGALDFSSKEYLLHCNLQYELLVRNQRPFYCGFTNIAYACKCQLSAYNAEASANTIRVFTLNNYDRQHPAGADVTAYFKTPQKGSNSQLEAVHHDFQVAIEENQPAPDFDLYLTTKPEDTSLQQFRVEVSLANGTVLYTLTPQVKLK